MLDLLRLRDPESTCREIEAFIRKKVDELDKGGTIIGLSGGVDSAVAVSLCANAIGADKVTALYMPDRDSNPKHGEDARRIADLLKIKFKTVDLTPLFGIAGIYDINPMRLLSLLPGKRAKGWAMRAYKYSIEELTGRNLFLESHRGSRDQIVSGGSAYAHFKRREHMVIAYLVADIEDLLVVGAANRTEWLTGVFVKWGLDSISDIMPLLPFYKSRVRQLARCIGLPADIVDKPADPDLFPGFADKEKMFGDEETLDRILLSLERGLSPPEIATASNIDLKEIERAQVLMENSRHMRESPYVPNIKI